MIRVALRPEPENFDERVRKPGQNALAEGKDPLPAYWRRCLKDLWNAYDRTCAYVGVYIPPVVGGRTVEHYVAKSSDDAVAYEWGNYRLACQRMNARKGVFDDLLDPFEIQNSWFALEFVGLQVLPSPQLSEERREQVTMTIARLHLNDEECVELRSEYFDDYRNREISWNNLCKMSPFIAREVERQGLKLQPLPL